MLRHRALLLSAICALSIPAAVAAEPYAMGPSPPGVHRVVGPTQILYEDADSIFIIRSQEWWSASVKHEEKLLMRSLRLKYWVEHLPPEMRLVFDTLGYPMNRLFTTPVGHIEEWWYYGMMDPPLRFRDGVLLDPDRYEAYLARR